MQRIRRWPLELRENLPLIAATAAWALSWAIGSRLFGLPTVTNMGIGRYVVSLLDAFATDVLPILALMIPLAHLLRGGRARELAELGFWRQRLGGYLNRRVLGGFLVALVCMPVFYAAYRDWKTALPAMVPFYLDPALASADRWLHAGRHPWEWLQSLLGHPIRTHLIDSIYVFWFEVQFGVVLWMAFTRRRWLRARFFISYILMYVLLGQFAATAFSSAGPVYFSRVVADVPDPFAPLLAYLHEINESTAALYAVNIQETLWGGYVGSHDGPVSGISAFPSLHVAVAALFLLVGGAVNRWVGAAFFALLILTQIGSVHLGWHYALDGYVAMVAVWALWRLSEPLTRALFEWAELDAMGDPSAPSDFRGDDARGGGSETEDVGEGVHGNSGSGRPQPSMP